MILVVLIYQKIQIIRSSNIGNGAGINKALEICQTNYALYMDIDVKLPNNLFTNLSVL